MKQKVTKILFTTALVFCAIFMFSATANAAPSRAVRNLTVQPNGEKFYATTYGDEFFHWTVTDNGDVIARGNDGFWHFAEVSDYGLTAGPVRYSINTKRPMNAIDKNHVDTIVNQDLIKIPPTRLKGKAIQNSLPDIHLGASEKMLVFAVSFKDVKIGDILKKDMNTEIAEIRNMMFGHKLGTVYNYYDTVSNGTFHFEKAVTPENSGNKYDGVVPITLNYNHPDPDGIDDGPHPDFPTMNKSDVYKLQIVQNTIKAADKDIDFSIFDKNHDGWISTNELHVVFLVAGYEAAYGNESPTVWAHSWSAFNDSDGDFSAVVDGVHMCEVNLSQPGDADYGKDTGKYTMQGEVHTNHLATIGTLCHELGHDCGLPDEYDYKYASKGVGILSLMGSGNWTKSAQFPYDGACPIQFDAFSKMLLNFVEPTIVTEVKSIKLNAFDNKNSYNIIKVPTIDPKQYFLIENRQPTGFDAPLAQGLKKCGIIIYHIDEAIYEKNGGHRINDDIVHKAVDVEEADEGEVGYSLMDANINYTVMKYDLAYYKGHNNVFNDNSTPNSELYNGVKSGINIAVNCDSANSMEVSVAPGYSEPLAIKSIAPADNGIINSSDSIIVTFTNDVLPGFLADPANRTNSSYQFNKINVGLKNGDKYSLLQCTKLIKGNQLIIKPNTPLKAGEYAVYIPKGSLKDKLGKLYKANEPQYNPLVSKFVVKGPLTVISTSPADKSTSVKVNSVIVVSFSENIKMGKSFAKITLIGKNGKPVDAFLNVSEGSNTLSIRPKNLMDSAALYKVSIPNDAVTSLGDIKLAKAFTFSFTTEDIQAPVLVKKSISVEKKAGAELKTNFILVFNEKIDLLPYGTIQVKDANGNLLQCTYSITDKTLTVTTNAPLQKNTKYFVVIGDSTVADIFGNAINSVSIEFITKK